MADARNRKLYSSSPSDVSHLNVNGMYMVAPKFEAWIAEKYAKFTNQELVNDADAELFFKDCYGVLYTDDKPQRIIIRAYAPLTSYLRTLPLHHSQKELKPLRTNNSLRMQQTIRTFHSVQRLQTQRRKQVTPRR